MLNEDFWIGGSIQKLFGGLGEAFWAAFWVRVESLLGFFGGLWVPFKGLLGGLWVPFECLGVLEGF